MTTEFVTTLSGKQISKTDCVKIQGEYFIKDEEVVKIGLRWYRKSSSMIYHNDMLNQYMRKTSNTSYGIVAYNDKTNEFSFGWFEHDFKFNYTIVIGFSGDSIKVCSKYVFDLIPKTYWKSNCGFYTIEALRAMNYSQEKDIPSNAYCYNLKREYNSERIMDLFLSIDNRLYADDMISKTIDLPKFESYVKRSFGLEFETSSGVIPQHTCMQLGLIPLKDGSISGHEYTTIPMSGKDGLNLLLNQLKVLNEYCYVDKECSLHLHFGGFKLDKTAILNLYNISRFIQNEIGNMFPFYAFNTGIFKSRGKDYCRKLENHFDTFEELYSSMADADDFFEFNGFFKNHPKDPSRSAKWNIHTRYTWINFINLLFGDGAKTVEFRLHGPTFNEGKILNWMLICSAILDYAESADKVLTIDECSKLSLLTILNKSFGKDDANELMEYHNERSLNFKSLRAKFDDSYGYIDMMEDKNQVFKTILHK